MYYDFQDELQKSIFVALSGDEEIVTLTAGAIFDHVNSTQILPDLYVRIGHETIRNRSSQSNTLSEIIFEVSVFSRDQGFIRAKQLSSKIAQKISRDQLVLDHAKLVGVWFNRSQTYRLEKGNLRQIKLWFKTIIETIQQNEVV